MSKFEMFSNQELKNEMKRRGFTVELSEINTHTLKKELKDRGYSIPNKGEPLKEESVFPEITGGSTIIINGRYANVEKIVCEEHHIPQTRNPTDGYLLGRSHYREPCQFTISGTIG